MYISIIYRPLAAVAAPDLGGRLLGNFCLGGSKRIRRRSPPSFPADAPAQNICPPGSAICLPRLRHSSPRRVISSSSRYAHHVKGNFHQVIINALQPIRVSKSLGTGTATLSGLLKPKCSPVPFQLYQVSIASAAIREQKVSGFPSPPSRVIPSVSGYADIWVRQPPVVSTIGTHFSISL